MDGGPEAVGSRPRPSPTLPSPSPASPLSFPFPPLPLGVGPLNPARGQAERCKLPQRVWGGAPAEIEFGTF